jgi:hypothetical protein
MMASSTLAVVLIGLFAGADDQTPPKSITTFGNTVQSACSRTESNGLRRQVQELVGDKKPGEAWAVIYAMLCGRDKQAERLVIGHMPEMLIQTESSTGDDDLENPPSTTIQRSASLMRRGAAWSASVISLDDSRFAVSFTSNEVCVGSFTLQYRSRTWHLNELGSACD